MRLAALAAAALLAGCGASGTDPPEPGGPLSVAEALEPGRDGQLLVRGYLIERDGELRLCEAILESYPPQCGEPSLRVEGAAPPPSEQRVSLLGEVEDGTITVSEHATG